MDHMIICRRTLSLRFKISKMILSSRLETQFVANIQNKGGHSGSPVGVGPQMCASPADTEFKC